MNAKKPKPKKKKYDPEKTLLTYKDIGIDKVKITVRKSRHPKYGACSACIKLDNKVYTVDDALTKMPIPVKGHTGLKECSCKYIPLEDGMRSAVKVSSDDSKTSQKHWLTKTWEVIWLIISGTFRTIWKVLRFIVTIGNVKPIQDQQTLKSYILNCQNIIKELKKDLGNMKMYEYAGMASKDSKVDKGLSTMSAYNLTQIKKKQDKLCAYLKEISNYINLPTNDVKRKISQLETLKIVDLYSDFVNNLNRHGINYTNVLNLIQIESASRGLDKLDTNLMKILEVI